MPAGKPKLRPITGPRSHAGSRPAVGPWEAYWGDVHVHTAFSADAEGFPDELIYYAQDKAGLDFMVLQDNDSHHIAITESEYALTQYYARHYHQDGRFVILPAFEWTQRGPNHRTVIAGGEPLPILRNTGAAGARSIEDLARHAERHGAIMHIHHENFRLTDSPAETNLEICSGWRVHMIDPAYREVIHKLLAGGRRLGFVGGSDNHRRNPGLGGALTLVYAAEKSRAAILEAFRQHRTVATDGSRIGVRFWINDAFIGESLAVNKVPEIRWEATLTSLPATVSLIRDGQMVKSWRIGQVDPEQTGLEGAAPYWAKGQWQDKDCPFGSHFYYIQVEEEGIAWHACPTNMAVAWGPRAWTSPIWVDYRSG
ncbi:MAG TPA: CehA/McbA family metallohydrolase [Firmicutes bacterium]|nr:CehA/McbA family metallohydrolase [Bacillota bacterium]